MFVRKVDKVDFTNNLKTFLMPIVWVEEVIVPFIVRTNRVHFFFCSMQGLELNDKMIKMLNDKMFTPLLVANILIYTSIGGGALIFFVCLAKLCKCSAGRDINQDKVVAVRPVPS